VKRRRITWGRWATNLLLFANLIVLAAIFWRLNQPPRPDPAIVGLAVRATVFALPTPTPYIVEVQVTRIYEITRLVQAPTPIPTATPAPPPSATPEPSAATATPPPAAERSFGAAAAPVAAIAEKVAPRRCSGRDCGGARGHRRRRQRLSGDIEPSIHDDPGGGSG
jgi:hypothetical protein